MRTFAVWRPNNRSADSYNRAVGLDLRLFLCALALVIGASVGQSQPVPDTILLPDSLGPLRPGYHLAFGSSTNNIYVASESSDIMVVDGNTFQRIKRINTGTPVGGALLVAQHNRVYCSYPRQGRIGIVDCATNSVVDSIQVGTRPTLLRYSSGSDKLYCGDTIDCTVSVINCATNAVLKVIPVGESLTAMAYDPTTEKVYVATGSAVLAISCSADSVVASIDEVSAARGLCINKRRQKLYVVGRQYQYPDTVYVISTGADSLVAKIPWDCDPHLACNELTDRLYGVSDDVFVSVSEIDCAGDTWIRTRFVNSYISTVGLFCDTVRNRLYYLYEHNEGGHLLVVDCTTLDVIFHTPVESYPDVLESDPARYRVMCAGGRWEGVLSVFDYKHDSLDAVGSAPLCGWKWTLCHNPVEGKLYLPWGEGAGGVGVIDEQTNQVDIQAFVPQVRGATLTYSQTSNKLYVTAAYGPFSDQAGLGVLDGSTGSLLKVIEMGDGYPPYPCYCSDENKVYCSVYGGGRAYIAVVDCNTDSVVREMDVDRPVDGLQYLGNHRLLCWEYDRLILLDCRTDSILVDTAVGANIYAVAHACDGEKVYIVHGPHGVEVLDASSLSLLVTVDWAYGSTNGYNSFLMCSDSTGKMYWFVRDSVLAIDTHSDTVVARLGVGFMQAQGCVDHSGRYIFNPNPDYSSLIIYDTQSDSVAAVYEDLPGPLSAISNPEQRCIYVGCTDVILVYPDAPPGVCEQPATSTSARLPQQSVVRGALFLPEATGHKPQAVSLLDASGRKVAVLHSGANDVRALAPGVYFVREAQAQAQAQAVRKVVIAR